VVSGDVTSRAEVGDCARDSDHAMHSAGRQAPALHGSRQQRPAGIVQRGMVRERVGIKSRVAGRLALDLPPIGVRYALGDDRAAVAAGGAQQFGFGWRVDSDAQVDAIE